MATVREASGNSPLVDETNVITTVDPNTELLTTISRQLDEKRVIQDFDIFLTRIEDQIPQRELANLYLSRLVGEELTTDDLEDE